MASAPAHVQSAITCPCAGVSECQDCARLCPDPEAGVEPDTALTCQELSSRPTDVSTDSCTAWEVLSLKQRAKDRGPGPRLRGQSAQSQA